MHQYFDKGAEQERNVHSERSTVDVANVHSHPVRERDMRAAVDLPNTCQSWSDMHSSPFPGLALICFVARQWTRSDQRHVTDEYVPQLRKFVDTGLAQEVSNRGNSRVAFWASASMTIVRNLKILNARPPSPRLFWINNIGPADVALIAIAATNKIGDSKIKPTVAPTISSVLFHNGSDWTNSMSSGCGLTDCALTDCTLTDCTLTDCALTVLSLMVAEEVEESVVSRFAISL
jgi:hypothetical protein